jgi:endonuclease/exonuclease/phosphatase family metal-dependent hydrolase
VRHHSIVTIIRDLLSKCDILCLQETHLPTFDSTALHTAFPLHRIFYNNYREGRAGTMVLVSPSFHHHYHILPVGLHRAARGRVQVLRFTPVVPLSHSPLRLINVYLSSGFSRQAEKRRQLRTLLPLTDDMHTIMLGDFNFTESPSDNPSSQSSLHLTGRTKADWDRIVERLRLQEVFQPVHTHYHICSVLAKCRTSRIDRVYVSHSETDRTIITPTAYIAHTKHNILNVYKRVTHLRGRAMSRASSLPDHLQPSEQGAAAVRG